MEEVGTLRDGWACLVLCFATLGMSPAQEAPAAADAPLYSMYMVDAREGWAVGDDGLIRITGRLGVV